MKTSHILQRYYLFLGNNIDVVQNVPCHFEQSEKSRKRPGKTHYNFFQLKYQFISSIWHDYLTRISQNFIGLILGVL